MPRTLALYRAGVRGNLILITLALFFMHSSTMALFSVVALFFWCSSAFAAVVSGSPKDAFFRAHPHSETAPEKIVYQVPDDKLEPGKLYHDVSKDGSRLVTRKRVVGTLGQSAGARAGVDYNGYLEYDVTFNYKSTRESQGEGTLTWSHNKKPKAYVNEQRLKAEAERLKQVFVVEDKQLLKELAEQRKQEFTYEEFQRLKEQVEQRKQKIADDVYKYMEERVRAHEEQHVQDAENPVWLYRVSNLVGSKQNLMDKSDREMINELNASLLTNIEKQRKALIFLSEARAVYAEVLCAARQINTFLSLKNAISEIQKKQYVPLLYEMLYLRKGEDKDKDKDKIRDRKSKATYGHMVSALKTKLDIFKLAEENVLLGSSADVRIDDADTGQTYSQVYEKYMPSANRIPRSKSYDGNSQNSTYARMQQAMSDYKADIEKMYQLIHAKLYKDKPYLKSLEDTGRESDTGEDRGRSPEISIKNFYDWLVYAEDMLEALPQSCKARTCATRADAVFYSAAVREKVAKKQELKDEEKIVALVLQLRECAIPEIIGKNLNDKEFFIKVTEKRADVLVKFISLISNNFNNNPLVEFLACLLVEESPVGGDLYANVKRHAIFMNNGFVPKSHDTPTRRGEYKWNHYRQEIINDIKKKYMETVNVFREQAKRARAN